MPELRVTGVGLSAATVSDWSLARAALRGEADWPAGDDQRPAPTLIPANERRRAPATVLLSVAAAEQACHAAGADPSALASVFASTWGDLAISDYMCATLARDPAELSPTRFHNSVHNAASGYWSIATGSNAPTTALAAGDHTFAAGLLEAAIQIADSGAPVLLVAYDIAGAGPMTEVVASRTRFACALLLDRPDRNPDAPRLAVAVAEAGPQALTPARPDHPDLAALAVDSPIAQAAGVLLEGLAQNQPRRLNLALGPDLRLTLALEPA